MTTPVIEFFFDIGSPYAYLAATQIEDLGQRTNTPVHWKPFLLGGVFKATGNKPPGMNPVKGRWMLQDLQRWAKHYGEAIRFPSRFPLNTLVPQRTLTAIHQHHAESLPAAALAIYRAYWVDDKDVSAPEVMAEILSALGLDGEAMVAATQNPDVKEALKSVTADAIDRGAFGAPFICVGDETFWGNDRLFMVERACMIQAGS